MIKLSYFITIKTELLEIKKLLPFIQKYQRPDDEIVILMDIPHNVEVENFLKTQDVQLFDHPLKNDFAQFKNYGTSKCKNDWIFNLDADEFPPEYLLKNIHTIIENNDVEVIWIPRINTVEGLTLEWAQRFGYKLDDDGWVNWPDPQQRMYKNDYPRIKWQNPVHERIIGFKTFSVLPTEKETAPHLAIVHPKTFDRQLEQNKKYAQIMQGLK